MSGDWKSGLGWAGRAACDREVQDLGRSTLAIMVGIAFGLAVGITIGGSRDSRSIRSASVMEKLIRIERAVERVQVRESVPDPLLTVMRARGLPESLAPVLRSLRGDEHSGGHYNADGSVITSAVRMVNGRPRVMVGGWQINCAPGQRRSNGWDVRDEWGNTIRAIEIFDAALQDSCGDTREALARYQGYEKPRSARALRKADQILRGARAK